MAPWLGSPVDDELMFSSLHVVFVGYACLVFLPQWKHTQHVTLAVVLAYSVLYAILLFGRVLAGPLPEGCEFGTLDGVYACFRDRPVVFAGWTHYIAFDLMVARHIVMNSQSCGIPHLAIVWTIPLTLMAGPCGLAAYYATKPITQPDLRRKYFTGERVLQALYCGATSFCIFMLIWILIIPASWRLGNTPGYEERVRKFVEESDRKNQSFTPPSLLLKYTGQRAIQFTHTIPSAFWAAAVPFQLHPGFRKNHRVAHKRMGYAFFLTGLSMMIGFAIIDYRHLDFMRNDFPTVPLHESTSKLGLGWLGRQHLHLFRVVGLAFFGFAGMALRAILKRDFANHRKWVLRHIGWGLWIAPQRMYVGMMQGKTPEDQKAYFTDGTFVGLAITALGAELAIWIYSWPVVAPPKEETDASAEVQLVPKEDTNLAAATTKVRNDAVGG